MSKKAYGEQVTSVTLNFVPFSESRFGHSCILDKGNLLENVRAPVCTRDVLLTTAELSVSRENVRFILTENCRMKEVCGKTVAKNLTNDQL
jgi:hypothetical protein